MAGNTVVWTVSHAKEENFLVANRENQSASITNADTGIRPPPVSLLTVSIPVQFQIDNLVDWAYKHQDAAAMLHQVGAITSAPPPEPPIAPVGGDAGTRPEEPRTAATP